MILVTCPCCHGEKLLQLFEEDLITNTVVICCHCGGVGTIEAEVEVEKVSIEKMNLWAKARQWLRS
jgi:Zn ribbon nucleic-acid-binding protein